MTNLIASIFLLRTIREMSLLIYSGLLYLLGISIILMLRPELMFAKDGSWKEFGLGRNYARYTWMPFWLFAILWAMVSYFIILMIASSTGLGGVSNYVDLPVASENIEPQNVSVKAMTNNIKQKPSSTEEMKRGYYILDMNESAKRGVPKYVYLGPDAPSLIHHDMTDDA